MGAARFLRGLRLLLDPERLSVIVNTGDDEDFFGLHISPDIDTVTYTLADVVDANRGWGVRGDTFNCLRALASLYGRAWFHLGDRDLATHIFRTHALRRGKSLSAITSEIARSLGVHSRILPMSDDPVRTFVRTAEEGPLPFQEYLVRRRGRGTVERISWRGIERAAPAPGVISAIRGADAVVISPSNPFVSIGPILHLPRVRDALRRRRAVVAAVSPIVGGTAVKGPAHRMLRGLGHEVSPLGVARLYADCAAVFVLDKRDAAYAPKIDALGMRPVVTETIMRSPRHARALASVVLAEIAE